VLVATNWVAVGTLALAGATFLAVLVGVYTAWFTRRLAEAAQTTAKADTRALENSVRPLLLPVAPGLHTGIEPVSFVNLGYHHGDQVLPETIHVVPMGEATRLVSVPVRNAGVGPAVIWVPHPSIRVPPDTAAKQGVATVRVVPVGERTRLHFALSGERLGDKWYVVVAYTDADGAQLRRTELAIAIPTGERGPEVVGFALYRGADDDLIVASGEGWDISTGAREWQ